MTSPDAGTTTSPWDLPEYNTLDARATKYQRLARAALVLELTLSVSAGFMAMSGERAWVLAALIFLMAGLLVGMLASRFQWATKWHEARSQAELLVSSFWRRSNESLEDEDTSSHAVNYLNYRILDQQAYYTRRAREFQGFSRAARTAVWVLYATCALIAALQVMSIVSFDLVGPAIALVASVRVWGESHQWERSAGVYAYCSSFLAQEAAQTQAKLSEGRVSAPDLAGLVQRVEDQLSSESERWLALNNFDLFDRRKYSGLIAAPTPNGILSMDSAWSFVQRQGLFLAVGGHVPARQLTEAVQWTNEKGEQLTGQPGDWLLGEGSERWTVIDSVFQATYQNIGEGLYEKHAPVRAVKLSDSLTLATLEGTITLEPGDWLVCNLSGECWGMSDSQFTAKYSPSPEGQK